MNHRVLRTIILGMGQQVDEVVMTKRTLYVGRSPATGAGNENSDPNVCRSLRGDISNIRFSISLFPRIAVGFLSYVT